MKRIAERFVEQSQVAIHNADGSRTVMSLSGKRKESRPNSASKPITLPEKSKVIIEVLDERIKR